MKIGMRTFKTALGVSLIFLIYQILFYFGFNYVSPFYASIAYVFGIQPSLEQTHNAAKNRIIGTLIGSLISLIIVTIITLLFANHFVFIFAGIGIIIIIKILNYFNKNEAVFIGCIVLIGSLSQIRVNPILPYIFWRTIETCFGLLLPYFINSQIAPPINKLN